MKTLFLFFFIYIVTTQAMHEAKYAHDDIKENVHGKPNLEKKLFGAIEAYSLTDVQDALTNGANINALKETVSPQNNICLTSPLMWAVCGSCLNQNNQSEKSIPIITFLLEQKNLDLNYYDEMPFSNALFVAMYGNNPEVTKILLDQGINISALDNWLEKNLSWLDFSDEIKQIFREKVEEYKKIAEMAATTINSATNSKLGTEIESLILGYVA